MEKRAAAIWLTILLKKQIKMKNTGDGIEEIWNGGINLGVWMICCACHALRQLGRCQLGRRQLGGHQLGQRELGRRHQTWVILGCWKKLETLVEAEETGRGRWGTNKYMIWSYLKDLERLACQHLRVDPWPLGGYDEDEWWGPPWQAEAPNTGTSGMFDEWRVCLQMGYTVIYPKIGNLNGINNWILRCRIPEQSHMWLRSLKRRISGTYRIYIDTHHIYIDTHSISGSEPDFQAKPKKQKTNLSGLDTTPSLRCFFECWRCFFVRSRCVSKWFRVMILARIFFPSASDF